MDCFQILSRAVARGGGDGSFKKRQSKFSGFSFQSRCRAGNGLTTEDTEMKENDFSKMEALGKNMYDLGFSIGCKNRRTVN